MPRVRALVGGAALLVFLLVIGAPLTGHGIDRDKGFQCSDAISMKQGLIGWIPVAKAFSERYGADMSVWINQNKRHQIIAAYSETEWCRMDWGRNAEFLDRPDGG